MTDIVALRRRYLHAFHHVNPKLSEIGVGNVTANTDAEIVVQPPSPSLPRPPRALDHYGWVSQGSLGLWSEGLWLWTRTGLTKP